MIKHAKLSYPLKESGKYVCHKLFVVKKVFTILTE
jgi:hypothetical protein